MIAVVHHIPIEVINPIKGLFVRSISHPIHVTLQIELVLRVVIGRLVPCVRHLLLTEQSAYGEPTSPHSVQRLFLAIVG